MFSLDEFRQALAEFEEPPKGAEKFLVLKEVWECRRRPVEGTGLFEYRADGEFDSIDMELLSRVYLDYEFRRSWDSSLLDVKAVGGTVWDAHDAHEHHFQAFYALKYPMFMANREYLYKMHRRNLRKGSARYTVILGSSAPSPASMTMPHLSSGHVVVDPYRQRLVLAPTSNGRGTRLMLSYFEDPGGYIPQAVINWAAKTGLPKFIDQLETACAQYPKWLLSKGRPPIKAASAFLIEEDAEDDTSDHVDVSEQ